MIRALLSISTFLIVAATAALGQLRVVSPNGGEVFVPGDTMSIVWAGVSPDQQVKIDFISEDGSRQVSVTNSTDGLTYQWKVYRYALGKYVIRVSTVNSSPAQEDASDQAFSVQFTSAAVKNDIDFGTVIVGNRVDTIVVDCITNPNDIHVNIDSIAFGGKDASSFKLIGPIGPFRVEAGSSVSLHLQCAPTRLGRLQVDIAIETAGAESPRLQAYGRSIDGIRKLYVDYPNGGEAFAMGDSLTYQWSNIPIGNAIRLDYSTDNGTTWTVLVDSTTEDHYNWIVPKVGSGSCLARVTGLGPDTVRGDTSDGLWRLDVPRADVYDHYDMPSAKVGESVTAVSDLFVKNRSAAKLYVESIWIEGAQASEYEIISGEAPFLLLSGERWAVGFRFTPKEAGLRVADAVTASRDADTVRTELRGIGISETTDAPETGERPVIAQDGRTLQMQPNPAQSDALIQYRLHDPARVRLTIYNSLGESIETLADGVEEAGLHAVHIDVSTLPSGMYIVALETASGRQTQTVIVER